MKNLN